MANKWFAMVLGFFIPPLAFVYLAKLRVSIIYLLLFICNIIFLIYIESSVITDSLAMLLSIVSAVHAYISAKNINLEMDKKWYSNWWVSVSIPIIILSLLFAIRFFVVDVFTVSSASMSPTLEMGNHVLVKKWGYGEYFPSMMKLSGDKLESITMAQRGEVVVVFSPIDSNPFIERIIGLPGDVIDINDKQIVINGNPVKTDMIDNNNFMETIGGHTYSVKYVTNHVMDRSGKWTIPDGYYFVMGDNRDNSADSRVWGMVSDKDFVGRLILKL